MDESFFVLVGCSNSGEDSYFFLTAVIAGFSLLRPASKLIKQKVIFFADLAMTETLQVWNSSKGSKIPHPCRLFALSVTPSLRGQSECRKQMFFLGRSNLKEFNLSFGVSVIASHHLERSEEKII